MQFFKTILVLFALFVAIATTIAEPYTITAWFEEDDTSFNIRFDPLQFEMPDLSKIRIFFPPGTIQARDRREMNCGLYSSGNRRYYEQPNLKPQSKYGNAKTTHLDVYWPASWFNPTTENLLVRCYGLKISPEDLQKAYETPASDTYTVWLDTERRNYTLKSMEESWLPNGKRF